jgi:hypothetical protein
MNNLDNLYKPAAIAATLIVLLIPVQILFFGLTPPPETPEGFFHLFNENLFLGLISLDLLYVVSNTLIIFVYLGLFAALRKADLAGMTVALVIGFIGIAAYYSSTVIFEMNALSHQYTEASTAISRDQITAQGNLLLLRYKGTAFDIYYVLNAVTLILISRIMLKDDTFSKSTAIWGLAAGILMLIPSTAGMLGLTMSLLSLIPWIVFSILITKRFFVLGRIKNPGTDGD